MELEIEVFWHNDESYTLEQVGVDFSMLEADTKEVTFYGIENIAPYYDEKSEQDFCTIRSGGRTFIATDNYEKIKLKIRNAMQFEIQIIKTL